MRDFNLFPTVDRLLTLERKYGDAINKEDLLGFKEKKKKKRRAQGASIEDNATTNKDGETMMTKS